MREFKLDSRYWINAGKGGTFRGLADEVWGISSAPKDVDKLFDYLNQNNINKLSVYIHGGLVPEYFGGKSAIQFQKTVTNNTQAHPVTFIWESGPHEVLADNFGKSLKSIVTKKLFKKAIKIIKNRVKPSGESLLVKGLDTITISEMKNVDDKIYEEISHDIDTDQEIVKLLEEEGLNTGFLTEDEYDEFNKSLAVFDKIKSLATFKIKLATAASRCLWRFVTKRSHGLLETILEELCRIIGISGENIDDIGQFLWSGMKNKAKSMFDSNAGRIGLNQYAGTYFLQKISEYQKTKQLEVDVFSTSAGAIAVCNMIKFNKLNHYGVKFRNLIFMAPAANFEDFNKSIIDCSDTYESFRIFTMKDERERKDDFLSIYKNSLLYLISGIFERKEEGNILFGKNYPDAPLVGMDRHIAIEPQYSRTSIENLVSKFINNGDFIRLVLSPVDNQEPGLNCTALKHGGFLSDEYMMKSIIAIINSEHPMK